MNDNVPFRWSALDLSPLPHESSLSIIWRLSWRNALRFSQIDRLCKGSSSMASNSFMQNNWIDTGHFREQTQWNLPQDIETDIADALDNLLPIWFDEQLRICPICLEHGYHSVWFQFRPLACCPLHHCELKKSCNLCDRQLAEYRFSKPLLDSAYLCQYCFQPLSGVAPCLQLHLDFRAVQGDLNNAFQPFAEWLKAAKEKLAPLRELERQNPAWRYSWGQWCRPSEFLLSIGSRLHPLPQQCSIPLYTAFIYRRWRVKMADQVKTSSINSRRSLASRSALPTAVYRSTLRQLQKWLMAEVGPTHRQAARVSAALSKNNLIELWNRDPRELGYMLLRMKVEQGDCRDLASSVSMAQIRDEPSIDLPMYQGRIPRQALRWVYLGMYMTLIHLIQNARRKATIDLCMLDLRDQALIIHAWTQEGNWISGVSVFPTVENCPLLKQFNQE